MKLERVIPKKSFVALGVVGGFILAACSGDSGPEASQATKNVAYISVGYYMGDYKKDANTLNEWLHNNPFQRVVAFTGILAYRSDNSGYEIVTEPGSNEGQAFEFVEAEDEATASVEIQEWVDSNPDRDMIAVASIPSYSGGAEGYVVLSVPAEE